MSTSLAEKPKGIPFGNYFLLERLAIGGMAEVYLAKSFGVSEYDRLVAVKRILPTIAEDDEFIAMFIDEAKIAGQLSHPNIASILDLGKIGSSYFIAMEYISGHDLRAIWERARESEQGMDIAMGCHAIRRVCAGLDYAHRRRDNRGRPLGIIHRDVSPQNVLVGYDGRVQIIDFGIAKAANRMVKTQTGILKGKFAYMAPEQARGELIDNRSDVFAIGVMFYEMLTGERAFKAETDFALLEKVRKVEVVPPRKINPKVPRDLERIVFRALAREPQDRYRYASEMANDIERAMAQHGLRYNREEMGAYARLVFKDDYAEELRRLEQYRRISSEDSGHSGRSKRAKRSGSAQRVQAAPGHASADEIFEAGTVVASVDGISALRDDGTATRGEITQVSEEQLDFGSSDVEEETMTSRPNPRMRATAPDASASREAMFSEGGEANAAEVRSEMTVVDTTQLSSEVLPSLHQTVARGQILTANSALPMPPPPAAHPAAEVSRPVAETFAPAVKPERANGAVVGAMVAGAATLASLVGVVLGAFLFAPSDDVVIATFPADVVVKVTADEQQICEATPCAARLGGGEHQLVFEAEGYAPLSKSIAIDGDEPARIVVQLTGEKSKIKLKTKPKGAKVTFNGKQLSSSTPLTLPEVVVGDKVTLKIEKNGFSTIEHQGPVPDLDGQAWAFDLVTEKTDWIVTTVPEDAIVDAAGKRSMGKTRVSVKYDSDKAVRIERPGCSPKMIVLTGTGEKDAAQKVSLSCKKFDASITVMAKSRLTVDIDGVEYPAKRWVVKYPVPAGQLALKLRGRRSGEHVIVDVVKGKDTSVPTDVR